MGGSGNATMPPMTEAPPADAPMAPMPPMPETTDAPMTEAPPTDAAMCYGGMVPDGNGGCMPMATGGEDTGNAAPTSTTCVAPDVWYAYTGTCMPPARRWRFIRRN